MREEGGVITRFAVDEIVVVPPLVAQPDEVDRIVGAIAAAVGAVTE